MKLAPVSILPLLAFCLAAANGQTTPAIPMGLPPLHPTAIVTDYDGQPYEITSVSGRSAQILYKGKPKSLPDDAGYRPTRAKAYASGFVALKSQKASSNQTSLVYMFSGSDAQVDGGVVHGGSNYEAIFESPQTIPDCYLVLIFFNQAFVQGKTSALAASLIYHHIGALPGGQPTKVDADFGLLDQKKGPYSYFPMVFVNGAEVRSNIYEDEAVFFRRLELMTHGQLLAAYRQKYPTADRPVVPSLQFAPIFPTPDLAASLPPMIHVSFTVTDQGLVDNLSIQEQISSLARRAIGRSLSGWQFYPRLVGGAPVSTPVHIPLNFNLSPPSAN